MPKIRSHKYKNAKTCKSVVGFDASSSYLYCSRQEMPCGKEEYVEIEKPNDPELINKLCKVILEDKLFGFLQVDIHVPDNLKGKFSEFSDLFVVDSVPENMKHERSSEEYWAENTPKFEKTFGCDRSTKYLVIYASVKVVS